MQRKLIKQGAGLTFYVPKKWVNRLDLKKGDDIQIDFQGNDLVISSTKKEKSLSEIKMDLPNLPETGVRTAIINAYRAGYDRIVVTFEGDKKFITNLTNNHMIGFEMFKKSKNGYILDSVASPSYEHFENMFQKQFFIILEMIRNTGKENLLEYANKIQRYDNYLKRCISKRVLETKFNPLFWQLLGLLTQISRNIFYLNKFLTKRKLKLNKVEQNYLRSAKAALANGTSYTG